MIRHWRQVLARFTWWLTHPSEEVEDAARQEFILNLLIFGCFQVCVVAIVSSTIAFFTSPWGHTFGILGIIIPLAVAPGLVLLDWLSRKGHVRLASVLFIVGLLAPVYYWLFTFGTDATHPLLTLAIITVITGIVLNGTASIIVTVLSVTYLVVVGWLQDQGFITVSQLWKTAPVNVGSVIVFGGMLCVISLVSWLSNREIERSLQRARRSEKALKKERDLIEIKVNERTAQLKRIQQEQLLQVHRFAEVGRMTSGLFHDLINPLTTVSLNLEQLKQAGADSTSQIPPQATLFRAMEGIRRMEEFILAARKQIQNQETVLLFSINDEIKQAAQVLDYRAKAQKVTVTFDLDPNLVTYGNPITFNQVMTNLIANAIDAYKDVKRHSRKRIVLIEATRPDSQTLKVVVHDWGSGIKPKVMPHIFDALFTTKAAHEGTGLGLSLAREIIERDFKGTITADSTPKHGTTFTVIFPRFSDRTASPIGASV